MNSVEIGGRLQATSSMEAAYLECPSLQTGILWKLGMAMEFNFFAVLPRFAAAIF